MNLLTQAFEKAGMENPAKINPNWHKAYNANQRINEWYSKTEALRLFKLEHMTAMVEDPEYRATTDRIKDTLFGYGIKEDALLPLLLELSGVNPVPRYSVVVMLMHHLPENTSSKATVADRALQHMELGMTITKPTSNTLQWKFASSTRIEAAKKRSSTLLNIQLGGVDETSLKRHFNYNMRTRSRKIPVCETQKESLRLANSMLFSIDEEILDMPFDAPEYTEYGAAYTEAEMAGKVAVWDRFKQVAKIAVQHNVPVGLPHTVDSRGRSYHIAKGDKHIRQCLIATESVGDTDAMATSDTKTVNGLTQLSQLDWAFANLGSIVGDDKASIDDKIAAGWTAYANPAALANDFKVKSAVLMITDIIETGGTKRLMSVDATTNAIQLMALIHAQPDQLKYGGFESHTSDPILQAYREIFDIVAVKWSDWLDINGWTPKRLKNEVLLPMFYGSTHSIDRISRPAVQADVLKATATTLPVLAMHKRVCDSATGVQVQDVVWKTPISAHSNGYTHMAEAIEYVGATRYRQNVPVPNVGGSLPLMANSVHTLDGAVVANVRDYFARRGIAFRDVHDEFSVQPAHMNLLRERVRYEYVSILMEGHKHLEALGCDMSHRTEENIQKCRRILQAPMDNFLI